MHLLNTLKSKFINPKNMLSQTRNSTAAAAVATSQTTNNAPRQTATKSKPKTNHHYRWQTFSVQQREWLIRCLTASILVCVVCIVPGFNCAHEVGTIELRSVVYSNSTKIVTYKSSTAHDARGMQPLYNISHSILNHFVGEKPLPHGYVKLQNGELTYGPKVRNNEWGDLVRQYWATLLFVIIVLICVFLMPIIGLCFCCCRCMGNCGARSEPFDKRHDTCRRFWYGLLLFLLVSGLLFGVIVIFTTNSFIDNGVHKTSKTMRSGGGDTQAFLDSTAHQVDTLFIKNYDELADNLKDTLKNTGQYVIGELEGKSQAVSLMYLTDFLTKLPEIRDMLMSMKTLTKDLRILASQLTDGLRGVKRGLLIAMSLCKEEPCGELNRKYDINTIDADGIRYDLLPDLSHIIKELEDLIKNNIEQSAFNGRDNLDDLRNDLNSSIAGLTPEIESALNNAGNALGKVANQIKSELRNASDVVGNHTQEVSKVAEEFINDYSPYRFYIGLAACICCLLILLCLIAALLCGICGKRAGGYGDDCCNKGTGARFLMAAVALIFLTFSAIALIAMVHFLMGIVAYRGFCLPFSDPSNYAVFGDYDECVDLNRMLYPESSQTRSAGVLPTLRVSDVIASCKENHTIYEVLRLQNRIDINDIKDIPGQFNINNTLQKLQDGINVKNMQNIQILADADKKLVLNLSNSALNDYDSGKFINNLGGQVSKYPLPPMIADMRATADKLSGAVPPEVKIILRNQALHMETYETNLVIPLKNQTQALIDFAYKLDKALRYKDRPLKDSIPLMVDEITKAENFITEEGPDFVKATAEKLSNHISNEINDYMDHVIDAVEHDIGKCGPMARVYDANVVHICNRIVDPLNGFWTGLFWCLLLFLPILCVAIRLACLYQKSDPYPGPLVESEYLYDAYSERDHIPMANGPKNKRRKNKEHRRRGEYYEDAVGPAPHGGVPASAAGVRDTRYNDMAPKHWDGGPPRYQNPPMAPPASEYERPPPYYYPGATEQD